MYTGKTNCLNDGIYWASQEFPNPVTNILKKSINVTYNIFTINAENVLHLLRHTPLHVVYNFLDGRYTECGIFRFRYCASVFCILLISSCVRVVLIDVILQMYPKKKVEGR